MILTSFKKIRIYRREFLKASIVSIWSTAFSSILVGCGKLFLSSSETENTVIRQNGVLPHDYAIEEQQLLHNISINPHHIRSYDRLIKIYGRFKEYDKIYDLLLNGRKVLEQKVSTSPACFKRYKTGLKLVNERIEKIERRRLKSKS